MTKQNTSSTHNLSELKTRLNELLPSFAAAYPERDEGYEFPHKEIEVLKDAGFMKLTVPENLGGFGATAADSIAITQQIAEAFPSLTEYPHSKVF